MPLKRKAGEHDALPSAKKARKDAQNPRKPMVANPQRITRSMVRNGIAVLGEPHDITPRIANPAPSQSPVLQIRSSVQVLEADIQEAPPLQEEMVHFNKTQGENLPDAFRNYDLPEDVYEKTAVDFNDKTIIDADFPVDPQVNLSNTALVLDDEYAQQEDLNIEAGINAQMSLMPIPLRHSPTELLRLPVASFPPQSVLPHLHQQLPMLHGGDLIPMAPPPAPFEVHWAHNRPFDAHWWQHQQRPSHDTGTIPFYLHPSPHWARLRPNIVDPRPYPSHGVEQICPGGTKTYTSSYNHEHADDWVTLDDQGWGEFDVVPAIDSKADNQRVVEVDDELEEGEIRDPWDVPFRLTDSSFQRLDFHRGNRFITGPNGKDEADARRSGFLGGQGHVEAEKQTPQQDVFLDVPAHFSAIPPVNPRIVAPPTFRLRTAPMPGVLRNRVSKPNPLRLNSPKREPLKVPIYTRIASNPASFHKRPLVPEPHVDTKAQSQLSSYNVDEHDQDPIEKPQFDTDAIFQLGLQDCPVPVKWMRERPPLSETRPVYFTHPSGHDCTLCRNLGAPSYGITGARVSARSVTVFQVEVPRTAPRVIEEGTDSAVITVEDLPTVKALTKEDRWLEIAAEEEMEESAQAAPPGSILQTAQWIVRQNLAEEQEAATAPTVEPVTITRCETYDGRILERHTDCYNSQCPCICHEKYPHSQGKDPELEEIVDFGETEWGPESTSMSKMRQMAELSPRGTSLLPR